MRTIKLFISLMFISLLSQSCTEIEYPIKLGDNYFIEYDSWGHAIIKDTRKFWIVHPQIVAWNIDSTFIIAKQKPFHNINEAIRDTASEYIRLYEATDLYNYWIIDKRKDLIWDENITGYTNALEGPFTYEEYWEKRRELNVSDTLKLKETEKMSFDTPIHYLFYKWFSPARRSVE